MLSRTASVTLMLAFLIGMSVLTISINPTKAIETVYINEDGSISPVSAPISTVDNVTYTFTNNIAGPLAVKRNNTIVDGNGHVLDAEGAWEGISLLNLTNIVIKNTSVINSFFGIELDYSSNCILSDNNITNAWTGYNIYVSCGNTISENNIITNRSYDHDQAADGIGVFSANNIVYRNNVSGYYRGIEVSGDNNTVSENNVNKNREGIEIDYCSKDIFSENYIRNNEYGVRVYYAPQNILTGNIMQNNGYDFGVDGAALSDFMNSIGTSNLVNGKPVYYLVNQSNVMISPEGYPDAGYLGLANCVNVTVQGFTFRHEMSGILLAHVNDSRIISNNLVDNSRGIDLAYSFNNTFSDNNVTRSSWDGMYIERSFGNRIFHNNFVNNSAQVYPNVQIYDFDSANTWDDGPQSGGNWWSHYNGIDNNQDGIGDTPCIIDANNTDHYPLMGTFQSFNLSIGPDHEEIIVISNSTVQQAALGLTNFDYPPHFIILLSVNGQDGTTSFCRITFQNDLLNSSVYPVSVAGYPVLSRIIESNGTHTTIYFTYNQTLSNYSIQILPEFPSMLILPLFFIMILVAVIVHRKRL